MVAARCTPAKGLLEAPARLTPANGFATPLVVWLPVKAPARLGRTILLVFMTSSEAFANSP